MGMHFYPLTVSALHRETPECTVIEFEIPARLKSEFSYIHGQNLTLKAHVGGQEVRRSYSICSAPHEQRLCVAVKSLAGGLFSRYVESGLRVGDVLKVLPPAGRFTVPVDAANKKNYLAIAAGSGITPVISILKTVLLTERRSSCTLVYGNRTRGSIIFFEELEALKNRYLEQLSIIHILSREQTDSPLHSGRIDAAKLNALARIVDYTAMDAILICGPEQMLLSTQNFLQQWGVAPGKIHYELFTSALPSATTKGYAPEAPAHTATTSQVTVQLDGRSFEFALAREGDSILDAALQTGADLPYACRGGMCSTCRARLVEGQVRMDVNYALETDELEQGFILTCQSHPLTDRLVVDFDAR